MIRLLSLAFPTYFFSTMSSSFPELDINSIIEGDRGRGEDSFGDLDGLIDSIDRIGLIHPIVLNHTSDGYVLVAGGRRLRALKELGIKTLVHGATLRVGVGAYVFADSLSESELRVAEIEENIYRADIPWAENILMVDNVHSLKFSSDPRWTQAQTAELFGYSQPYVSRAVTLAKLIRNGDSEILAAADATNALRILVKRKEDEALARRARIAAATAPTAPMLEVIREAVDGEPPTPEPVVEAPTLSYPLSKHFLLGDSMELLPTIPDESYDHIVSDPPYGIDVSLVNATSVADIASTHDVDQNISMFEPFLRESFRIVRPGGFVVFFYDLDHHEKLQTLATSVGFKVQRWPILWVKPYPNANGGFAYNFNKNYECAMVLRRDKDTVLKHVQVSSWFEINGKTDAKRYNNPFSKPEALWHSIYKAIALPGQSVFDPFAGEFSAGLAAYSFGLVPYGIEISEQHYNRGLEHMRKAVISKHPSHNVIFT